VREQALWRQGDLDLPLVLLIDPGIATMLGELVGGPSSGQIPQVSLNEVTEYYQLVWPCPAAQTKDTGQLAPTGLLVSEHPADT